MAKKAMTFRTDERLAAALAEMGQVVGCSVNQLITEAVRLYLARRGPEVERELEDRLERLRSYRAEDPEFEEAIEKFVEAEAGHVDPAEGTIVGDEAGPTRSEIRTLLNA